MLKVLSIIPDVDIIFVQLTGAQLRRPIAIRGCGNYSLYPIFHCLPQKSRTLFSSFNFTFPNRRLLYRWKRAAAVAYFNKQVRVTFLSVFSPINILLELTLFLLAMLVLYKSKDYKVFFSKNKSNLLLIIPILTVLLPTLIGFPLSAPSLVSEPAIAIAHLFYLVLFSLAVLKNTSIYV